MIMTLSKPLVEWRQAPVGFGELFVAEGFNPEDVCMDDLLDCLCPNPADDATGLDLLKLEKFGEIIGQGELGTAVSIGGYAVKVASIEYQGHDIEDYLTGYNVDYSNAVNTARLGLALSNGLSNTDNGLLAPLHYGVWQLHPPGSDLKQGDRVMQMQIMDLLEGFKRVAPLSLDELKKDESALSVIRRISLLAEEAMRESDIDPEHIFWRDIWGNILKDEYGNHALIDLMPMSSFEPYFDKRVRRIARRERVARLFGRLSQG